MFNLSCCHYASKWPNPYISLFCLLCTKKENSFFYFGWLVFHCSHGLWIVLPKWSRMTKERLLTTIRHVVFVTAQATTVTFLSVGAWNLMKTATFYLKTLRRRREVTDAQNQGVWDSLATSSQFPGTDHQHHNSQAASHHGQLIQQFISISKIMNESNYSLLLCWSLVLFWG